MTSSEVRDAKAYVTEIAREDNAAQSVHPVLVKSAINELQINISRMLYTKSGLCNGIIRKGMEHRHVEGRRTARYKGRPSWFSVMCIYPFQHPNFLDFPFQRHTRSYNCGQVICLGDLVDNHAISQHQKEIVY